MKVSNRIVANTLVMYIQLIVKTIIGLFITRFVLKALGSEDYGIYMLVAGVVATLNVLSGSMSNTSMRYMAHSLGSGDKELMSKTFNTTLLLHFIIGGIVILLMEAGGWLMFDYLLNIPSNKILDAKIVFQFMIVTTFVSIISVPYDAVMNSHENLLALSIVDIFGYVLKLGLAIYLLYSDLNLLIIYGASIMIIQMLLRVIKQVYAHTKYEECKINFKKHRDSNLWKSILSFTGWEFFRSLAALCSTQLRGILINMFFGVRLNAAEGIGKTVNAQVNLVSVGVTRAITPQIIKSEGSGDRNKMLKITEIGVKYTTFLFSLVAVPLLFDTPYLLKVWLVNVPEFAVVFCQLSLVLQLTDKFTWQIGNAIRAVGDIKIYQITEGIIAIVWLVFAYIVFSLGGGPVSIYLVELVGCIIIGCCRLYFGHKIVHLSPMAFIKDTTLPVLLPMIVAIITVIPLYFLLHSDLLRLVLMSLLFAGIYSLVFWKWSICDNEKKKIKDIIQDAKSKLPWKKRNNRYENTLDMPLF